jgi:hypothetical protein
MKLMNSEEYTPQSRVRRAAQRDSEADPTEIVPFGRNGAGHLTDHPVGLVVVFGLLFMGLVGIPEARLFFAGALILGGACGFFLWLRHR